MAQQPQQSVFPNSHVGFDTITDQIERKLVKRGFQFNVICVGTSASVQCDEWVAPMAANAYSYPQKHI